MTIAYPVKGGLYVNLTNRCPCACKFCIRNNASGAYGSDPLWLEHEPTVDETMDAIKAADPASYSELVFCGYGEPTERLDALLEVAAKIRADFPTLPIRVNTNGLSDLISGEPTAQRFAGLVDEISISLNTATAEEYVALCRPKFGLSSYAAILEFARAVKAFVPKVVMTVVATADFTDEQRRACEAICESIGVPLRVRNYVG